MAGMKQAEALDTPHRTDRMPDTPRPVPRQAKIRNHRTDRRPLSHSTPPISRGHLLLFQPMFFPSGLKKACGMPMRGKTAGSVSVLIDRPARAESGLGVPRPV